MTEVAPRRRSRWWIAGAGVVVVVVLYVVLGVVVGQHFSIPSASMAPAYPVDSDVWAFRFGTPERGDAVVFDRPAGAAGESSGQLFKRIVAVGGQTVSTEGGKLLVDGRPVDEPYLAPGTVTTMDAPVVVPEGQLFVLGDARQISQDSRYFGPIDEDSVVGIVHLDW